MLGTVFNIQRFSLYDGPGVRTVVFLKGCPLKCVWCHNPEGIEIRPQIMYDEMRCISCGDCGAVCPKHRHFLCEGRHLYLREGCDGCGKCAEVCPTGAVTVAGKLMETEAVMAQVMRDFFVYRESGGGMTLSGGEPLYQAEFAVSLLRAAKECGINTCVETSGFASPDTLRAAARYTDIFYYDCKATDNGMHRRFCGVPFTPILENLALLCRLQAKAVLRCPIVSGINDTAEHIRRVAEVARDHSCITEIQLEPYHRLGISKSEKLGQAAGYAGVVPAAKKLEDYCRVIAELSGKPCKIS